MNSLFRFFLAVFVVSAVITSCRKVKYSTDPDAKLSFSEDTIMFDTVFTGIGSATRFFIVYNDNELPIKISQINLLSGSNSNFRININGVASTNFEDITIDAKDSIFVFADVNIDPQNDDVIEYDRIQFYLNGNEQYIHLIAYGQDIHLLNGSVINSQTWTNDKPYVIYNSALLNENQVLTIEAGTHIYSHRNSSLIILGSLVVNGTYNDPVIFEGDRLNSHSSIFINDTTDSYDDVAGQWNGIWLTKLSKNNVINFAEIKNAVIGIQVDSTQNPNPQLSIHNSKLEHHSYAGIFTQISKIFATNCLIDDCGYYNIAITRGGSYEFYHCTIANYWNGVRRNSAVYLNNFYKHPDGTVYLYNLANAYFGNCIIWGNYDTEIEPEEYPENGVQFNYLFNNCILKIDAESELNTDDTDHFLNIQLNDPLFADFSVYDFTLSENSPAINSASNEIINLYPSFLNFDLNNNSRISDEAPDIGVYEYQ